MADESTNPDLVDLTRESMEATTLRDFDAAIGGVFAPEAVFDVSTAGLGSLEGRAAIRRYLEGWLRAYEEQKLEHDLLCATPADRAVSA